MSDLMARRLPAPTLGGPLRRTSAWLRSAADILIPARIGHRAVTRLAEIAALAREPEEVRVALVQLASEVSGADRVELSRDRIGRGPQKLASWPPTATPESIAQPRSATRGPIAAIAHARETRPGLRTLQLAVKAGDSTFGTLHLTAPHRRPWPASTIGRLETLCAIAATAERGLGAPARGDAGSGIDSDLGRRGSATLGILLGFALAQARRRHEPISLLEVAVDRLTALRALLGDGAAETAIERTVRTIEGTIRASDIVARIEGGRMAVLLPNASAEDALGVAEAIRSAIARTSLASTEMPTLTASIGVASYPAHALDLASFRAAAASALTRAQAKGHDLIATAIPIAGLAPSVLAQRVG